jgi:hypothetical protein
LIEPFVSIKGIVVYSYVIIDNTSIFKDSSLKHEASPKVPKPEIRGRILAFSRENKNELNITIFLKIFLFRIQK